MTKQFDDLKAGIEEAMSDEYLKYKKEFVDLCDKFDVEWTEDMVQEAFEEEADPYDYLYEIHGKDLESEEQDD